MSQTSCCVPGCTSRSGGDAKLHHFPNPKTDIERFRTWVMKVGGDIVGLENNFIFKNRRVCSRHFEPVYIYPKKLSTIAVPLLHLSGLPARNFHSSAPQQVCTTTVPVDIPATMTVLPSTSQHNTTTKRKRNGHCQLQTQVEIELQNAVTKTKNEIKKQQKTKKDYKERLAMTKKLLKQQAYETVTKNLNPAARTFFAMQVKQARKKKKGRRFTLDEKILALSLYKPSPKAYRILSQVCILPHRRTLDKIISKVTIVPGINEILFQHLKERVKKMPTAHKFCSLIFDEMTISPKLTYDAKDDVINGFCDDGKERTIQFSDHVLVFMVRGIFKKYKQPISSKAFLEVFLKIENITNVILQDCPYMQNIGTYIKLIVNVNIDFDFIKCTEHKEKLTTFLIAKCIYFFMNNYIKEVNNILSGKLKNYDENDNLKNLAQCYFAKHKKNCRVRETGIVMKV